MNARGPGKVWVAVAVLLAALFLQQVLSMRLLSATFDETTHLPSGYSYLKTGDFRLNPQHPPLIKLLCGLPLLLLAPEVDFEDPSFTQSPPDEWNFGGRMLYGNDADRLLFWGRMPNVLLSLVLALYVFVWARKLYGSGAGLLALFLCAFSPTVIAHGRLVTFDLGLACFSTMTLYHLWRFSRAGAWRDAVLGGVGLGLALASKFSGVLLLAPVALLLGLAVLVPARGSRLAPRRAALALPLVVLLAALVVHAAYFFPSDPGVYLEGLRRVNADHQEGYASYLMGQFKIGGWWYYFILAFLIKTPVVTLLLLLLAVVFFRRFPSESLVDDAFVVVPALAYVVFTSALADNLGIRYLLPVYPLVFVFVSRLARAVRLHRATRVAAAVLGLWYAGTALWIYPDQLAYFNEFVGGPSRGHLCLDDSNIDWGQDVKRIKARLDREGIGWVRIRYGPTAYPAYYGIRGSEVTDEQWIDPPPGVYVLGTHVLIRGEYYHRTQGLPTDWLSRYEPIGRVGYSAYLFRFE